MVVRGQALDGAERDVAILLQPDDAFCLNQPTRMLGKAQLRIRCLQVRTGHSHSPTLPIHLCMSFTVSPQRSILRL